MNYDTEDCCPKCNRPECKGDCGLFSRQEKEDFIKDRYFRENLDSKGRIKVSTIQLEKNPQTPLKLGGYSQRTKKKSK